MINDNLRSDLKELEITLSRVYNKYEENFTTGSKEEFEDLLYAHGEYELAVDCLIALLTVNNIRIDSESYELINKSLKLMGLERPEFIK